MTWSCCLPDPVAPMISRFFLSFVSLCFYVCLFVCLFVCFFTSCCESRPFSFPLSDGCRAMSHSQVSETLSHVMARGVACFGVCLGLQGMVEYFGGKLGILESPVHGKPGTIIKKQLPSVRNSTLARGISRNLSHSKTGLDDRRQKPSEGIGHSASEFQKISFQMCVCRACRVLEDTAWRNSHHHLWPPDTTPSTPSTFQMNCLSLRKPRRMA